GLSDWRVAYQSAGATPEPWLGPEAGALLTELAARGHRAFLIVPFGFVCDHVEILYDVDVTYRALAARLGVQRARPASLTRAPARAVFEAGARGAARAARGGARGRAAREPDRLAERARSGVQDLRGRHGGLRRGARCLPGQRRAHEPGGHRPRAGSTWLAARRDRRIDARGGRCDSRSPGVEHGAVPRRAGRDGRAGARGGRLPSEHHGVARLSDGPGSGRARGHGVRCRSRCCRGTACRAPTRPGVYLLIVEVSRPRAAWVRVVAGVRRPWGGGGRPRRG